jgi:hypothetical protein
MFGLNYTPSKFLEPKNISPSRRTWKRIGQKNILLTSQTCRPVPHTRPTSSSDDAISPQPPPIQSNNGHGSSRETGRTEERTPPRPRSYEPRHLQARARGREKRSPATTRPPLSLVVSSSTCSCSSTPPKASRPPIPLSPAHGARKGSIGSAPAEARCGSRWR